MMATGAFYPGPIAAAPDTAGCGVGGGAGEYGPPEGSLREARHTISRFPLAASSVLQARYRAVPAVRSVRTGTAHRSAAARPPAAATAETHQADLYRNGPHRGPCGR